MVLLTHVIIALSSVAWTTYLYARPSRRGFYVAYVLIAATLASGTYLVISTHSPLLPSCASGLAYLIIVTIGISLAGHRIPENN